MKKQTISVPADLKTANRAQILKVFSTGREYSIADIAALTGLSRQTSVKAVRSFLQKGVLISLGKGASTSAGGKRPELFSLAEDRYMLCVTVWPGLLNLHLYNLRGAKTDSLCLALSLPGDIVKAMDTVGQHIRLFLGKNGLCAAQLAGVAFSTSGIVDHRNKLLKFNSNMPAWGSRLPLEALLRPYIGADTPFFLENAGKMTARPLQKEPSLASKRVLVVFAAWGLSACLIDHGKILNGKNALIGEIGHMVLNPEDPALCGCGSHGCFEALVSRQRIREFALREQASYPASPLFCLPIEQLSAKEVFEACAKEDVLAGKICDYLAEWFAFGLRNVCLTFDPETVVFQGDYGALCPRFDQKLKEMLFTFRYFSGEMPFEVQHDSRPITELDASGGYLALIDNFLSDPHLMAEED